MTKNKKILFIGKRLDAIKTALEAGYDIYVLNFEKIKGQMTKKFKSKKYFEIIYSGDFKSIEHINFDVVIPVTEKAVGLAYEFFKVRGRPIEKYFLCHNKPAMKEHARKNNIPITDFKVTSSTQEIKNVAKTWGFPLVLKEIDCSGSRGQIILESEANIPSNFAGKQMLVEKWIDGTEFSVESFIFNNEIIFTNITQYHTHHHCNILPAQFENEIKYQILKFNKNVIEKFQIKNGMVHAEYFKTKNGLIFGEIAVRPPGGYLMKLIELAYGFSPWRVLLDIKTRIKPFLYTEPQFFTAAWIIHPGEGVVQKEPDLLPILNHPVIVDIKCGLKKGMRIPKREGSGQDFGRILMKSKDIGEIFALIEKIKLILE